jgi:hypothetical protein
MISFPVAAAGCLHFGHGLFFVTAIMLLGTKAFQIEIYLEVH